MGFSRRCSLDVGLADEAISARSLLSNLPSMAASVGALVRRRRACPAGRPVGKRSRRRRDEARDYADFSAARACSSCWPMSVQYAATAATTNDARDRRPRT